MFKSDLKQKAISSMFWAAVQKYSSMLISFVSGIVLARLLTPYDYGCIGMLAIFMTLAESFIEGGFGSALIQKKYPTQADYSTIFFWNLGMACILYVILYACAPAIAQFYHIPILSTVLRVQGIVLFIYAFNIVQRNQLRKRLEFKVLSIVAIINLVISLSITILLAYNGFGVWALVAQNLVSSAIPAIVFWFYIRWRPVWTFSWQSFREMFSFGFYMFLTHIVNNFSEQIQGLLIGKMYSPSTLGYYSKAHSTERLASKTISQVMTQVTYPLYAAVQDDKSMMITMIKRMTSVIAYVTFPMLFILLLVARPLFVLLYSERWLASIPFFQVLCIAGLAVCLQAINLQTISAIGRSGIMLIGVLVKRVVGLSAIVLGLFFFGMRGLLLGFVINTWFSYFFNIYLVSKYIGYRWFQQLMDLMPVFIASSATAMASFACGHLLQLTMYPDGSVKLLIYIFIYMSWSFIFKPKSFLDTREVVSTLMDRFHHRRR